MKEVTASFEKDNPGFTVKDVNIPTASFWDKQRIDVLSGKSPDIATLYDPDIRNYIEADLLEPLNPWLEKAGYKMDDFVPAANLAVKDGKIYGILYQSNVRALFYNKKLLQEKGIAPPTNVQEFYAAVKALRDPAKNQYGFATFAKPGSSDIMYIEIMPIVAGFGGGFFKDGKPSVTAPETVAALEFYKKLYDDNLIPKGMDHTEYRQMFVEGKVVMYASGSFMAANTELGNKETFANLGAMPLPFPGGKTISVNVFLGIPKNSQHKDDAAKYLLSFLKDDAQRRMVEIGKAIPMRKGMVPDTFIKENPWFEAFANSVDVATSYAPNGAEQYGPEISKAISQNMEYMLFNDKEPKQVAEKLQKELEALMASKKK